MITTQSHAEAYQTAFSNPEGVEGQADAPRSKGGDGAGFGPHELLEAALATCLNMAVRMRAAKLGIPLDAVATSVELDRSRPESVTFNYRVEISGDVDPALRQALEEAATTCPVRQTLSKGLIFQSVDGEPKCQIQP